MTEPVPRLTNGGTVGPVDATKVPRYAGEGTFARLPRLDEVGGQADVAIVGVPFDSGVSYRPGARFGPSHIRESSRLLRPYNPELKVPVFAGQQVADAGDIAVNPFSIDEAIAAVERGARALLERAPFVLTLGGDHTIALPLLRAVSAVHGPVAVVHFDAHLDTWTPTSVLPTLTEPRSAGPPRKTFWTERAVCTLASEAPCTPRLT